MKSGSRRTRTTAIASALAVLLSTGSLRAEHLVTPTDVQGRLQQAESARARDLARLDGLLQGPDAQRAARMAGVDAGLLRHGLATLSNSELRDLAQRAAALDQDPVAGYRNHDLEHLLYLVVIVVLIVVLIKAVG